MAVRRILISGVALLFLLGCWLVGSSVLARISPNGVTAVRVAQVSFYSRMKNQSCAPASSASNSFPASGARVYDLVRFNLWRGRQTVRTEWYAPSGQFYDALAVRDRNVNVLCGYLTVYGDEAATHTGWWRMQVVVGDQVLKSKSFKLVPVQPDPQRLIQPSVCRHGCVADLWAPFGYRVHRNFATTAALIRYLRWHPGTHIQTVIGNSA